MTGIQLRRIRRKLKLSQLELGQLLGYKQGHVTVGQFERGERKINARVVWSIKTLKENIRLKKKAA